jgi:hypothetical protein
MHPDYHEHVVKPLLELPDPREQVEAVDSAVRPEVEDDDLAAQVGDAEWALDVEPVKSLQELRRAYGGLGGERHGRRAHGSPADAVTASLKGRPTMLVDTLVHGSAPPLGRRRRRRRSRLRADRQAQAADGLARPLQPARAAQSPDRPHPTAHVAPYGSQAALAVARDLDAKIERLLETAAPGQAEDAGALDALGKCR